MNVLTARNDASEDVLGRMLTRTDTSGTTTFVWDGMQCVMETDPAGVVTRYNYPNGRLMSFSRTVSGVTSYYQVHFDALQSIRKVTDSTGAVVATFDTDSYGNPLASTSDSVPNGGLQYRFVGALGVRWDAATGLYYMRQRWYDPGLGRFISRDPKRSANAYRYAKNAPTVWVDPSGRDAKTTIQQAITLIGQVPGYSSTDPNAVTVQSRLQQLLNSGSITPDTSRVTANDPNADGLTVTAGNPSYYSDRMNNSHIYLLNTDCQGSSNPASYAELLTALVHEEYHSVMGGDEVAAYTQGAKFDSNLIFYLETSYDLSSPYNQALISALQSEMQNQLNLADQYRNNPDGRFGKPTNLGL